MPKNKKAALITGGAQETGKAIAGGALCANARRTRYDTFLLIFTFSGCFLY